jgi:hypothetical protein
MAGSGGSAQQEAREIARTPTPPAHSLGLQSHTPRPQEQGASPTRSVMSDTYADRKRRVRCWFILARGATPSTATSTFGGVHKGRRQRSTRGEARHRARGATPHPSLVQPPLPATPCSQSKNTNAPAWWVPPRPAAGPGTRPCLRGEAPGGAQQSSVAREFASRLCACPSRPPLRALCCHSPAPAQAPTPRPPPSKISGCVRL